MPVPVVFAVSDPRDQAAINRLIERVGPMFVERAVSLHASKKVVLYVDPAIMVYAVRLATREIPVRC